MLACCIMIPSLASSAWNKDRQWECRASTDGVSWDCGKQQALPTPLSPQADAPVSPTINMPPQPQSGTAAGSVPEKAVEPERSVTAPEQAGRKNQRAEEKVKQAEMTAPTETSIPAPEAEPVFAITEPGYEMPDLDEGLDSMSCKPAAHASSGSPSDENQALQIEADSGVASPEDESAHFSGNVVLLGPEHEIHAQDLSYSRKTGEITTQGEIQIRTDDIRLQGERAQYSLSTQQGSLHNLEYRILSQHARGHAELAEMNGRQTGRYENVSYTTCPAGNDDFVLSARSLTVDQVNESATFESVKLGFLGVPVFYFPKLSVSLNNDRKSGLLIPELSYSSKNGLDLAVPYYLNLAPNYDATLIPRVISKRGPALGGEFRFLTDRHRGDVLGEILYDRKYEDGGVRGAFHVDTKSRLAPHLSGNVLINYVSDDDYLKDLGNSLAVSSTQHLLNRARLTYHADFWDLYGDITHYDTLDDAILIDNRPYSQLPRIRFDLLKHDGPGNLDYSMLAEYIYFYRDTGVTGHRLDLNPGISFPWRTDWAYVEPEFTARYTGYQLRDQPDHQKASQNRTLFSASIDSGLFFDRSNNWFGHNITQTLEPRAYYLYVPYEDQSDLPVFDTGVLDFSFDNLFRGNRFNGPDRVGDANQLALALSSSLLNDASGEELLRASIGQIYYFEDRRVTLPGYDEVETSSSSVIAQIDGRINTQWQYRAGVQVDPHADQDGVRQGLAQVIYHGEQNQLFNAAYRLREGVVEQTDIGFIWPVTRNMSVIGRWYYSLQDAQTMEAVAGVEYGRCCWRIRAVVRHYLDNDGQDYNDTAMIQLELNGLGKLGHDIDNYLDRSIYGY